MQLITDEYRKLNEELHEENKNYGTMGKFYLTDVVKLLGELRTKDVLDYGCGKSTLSHNLPFTINQYDPAIPQYSEPPEPADLVVCTDVLEHIEPELLDNVLADLARLTKKICYVTAATIPAKKILSDGRNAHLIVENMDWWTNKFKAHFTLRHIVEKECQVIAIMLPKEGI